MKSILKKAALVFLFVFLCLASIFGMFLYVIKYKKTELASYQTGDGKYTLEIYQVGEPVWPFGPTKCRFEIAKEGERLCKYDFSIANDGKNASMGNFEVYFQTENAVITVSGEEQGKIQYDLFYDGTINVTPLPAYEPKPVPEPEPASDESENYDEDGVLNDYDDQRIKQEYEAIFDYLTSEGQLANTETLENPQIEMNYYYSAKGEERVVVCTEERHTDGTMVCVEHELRYNKQIGEEDEFVYQTNFYDEAGNTVQDAQIADFFLVNRETLEVTDTGRTTW